MDLRPFASQDEISPTQLAAALHTTKSEIAATLGLGTDALTRKQRLSAPKTQTRLREMLEIINRVELVAGSPLLAYAWFRSEPLPGFGGMTSDQLVREGHADWVHRYLDQMMAGGFA